MRKLVEKIITDKLVILIYKDDKIDFAEFAYCEFIKRERKNEIRL